MTKSTPKELATKAAYNKRPDVQAKRVEENRARRHAEAKGLVHKGDGKDVDHKVPLGAGGSGSDANTRVITKTKNRGWRKGESSYKPKKV